MGLLGRVPVFVLRMGARIALMRGEPRGEVEQSIPNSPLASQPASSPCPQASLVALVVK